MRILSYDNARTDALAHDLADILATLLPIQCQRGNPLFARRVKRRHDHNRCAGMPGAHRIEERRVNFSHRFAGLVVGAEVQDEASRVNLRHRGCHFRFAQAVAAEAQVHEVNIEPAAKNGLVTHAGPAGAAALGDGCAVEHDWLGQGERFGRSYLGLGVHADAQDFHRHVKRQIEGDFPLDSRLVRKVQQDSLIDLSRLGVLVRNGGS